MKEKFQDGWEFQILPFDTALSEVEEHRADFREVEIPHDWLIEDMNKLADDVKEAGWYRKVFTIEEKTEEAWILCFDGIYMDSTVFLNGYKVCDWKNGYTCFEADLTPYLVKGENEILVQVKMQTPNSRWYSGAGIYRSVWLKKRGSNYIEADGVYISTKQEDGHWNVEINTEVHSDSECEIVHRIKERHTEKIVGAGKSAQTVIQIENPNLWTLKNPALYEVVTALIKDGKVLDEVVNRIGFRTIVFCPAKGFFLNGEHVKINGVCEHHDLGCLGSAFHKGAMRRKLEILKDMGTNGVRISHNMPAREVIELAEEMGILIVTELYDMWERPKTTYDFARFFQECYEKDVAAWVKRDRNSPCVIMWSIGNEIYDTHASDRGVEITKLLMGEVKKHDPRENAKVTLASNYMPWENAGKCADVVKLAGYNYGEKYYKEHHAKHPDWILYGSETASVVQSRGIYHFPASKQILTDDDRQCSSLGNSITSWGARNVEACILTERDNSFSCGQFIWTGFDYIGEPTPYHTKNSYFGQIDTAGFPKDAYYLYQSAWTDYKDSPMIHVYPYWDFNDGQVIDVGICTNAPETELFVNGISKGRQKIDQKKGKELTAKWQIPYEKGSICGVAYDENGVEIARKERHSFGDSASIKVTAHKGIVEADGEDLRFLTIEMLDAEGNLVENANDRVEVRVSGASRLLGLDNGDSTDMDAYKGTSRRLFSGKLLAVVESNDAEGEIQIEVDFAEEIPVRKIGIYSQSGNQLSPKQPEINLEAKLYPANTSYTQVEWSVTDDMGIPSTVASLTGNGLKATVKGIGDGSCRVRCMTRNGSEEITMISQMEFTITGMGCVYLNPYEFLSAGLYTYSKGVVGNGNERGVATARDGETQVGFENIDFGVLGSEEIQIPIFALTDEAYPIQIWEGIPGEEGSQLIADVVYQKPSLWNTYQEETFHLRKRLTGITTIYFVLKQKVHIKGFTFEKYNPAFKRLHAGKAQRIYGDSFQREELVIKEIGNNVSLEFIGMDFGQEGAGQITICGNSGIECNSIHLCFLGADGEDKQLLEFTRSKGSEERTFVFPRICGVQDITFLFLPGSKFDFEWFQFKK